ncbi:emp24/gp25L/p24 family/GOLD-domain-containing protein [Piptocephalis cylindrospora]|uniref:Emp24/gp25L/p24 family/GOLD-domain-containing protein n=1 Tax=Piptocephalis cylindrospora TaxID=1907219 RepID=A0A4V1IXR9_9FUNG|nr:emp24/gp25L/p24 family/GOLD-domain-containing protein [Piptocephalis cylindrospora]|eukprot:RKP12019.1 emp24/gp25L/p24 family/GOLD-domain-containing protein [Piptocephalis cylindrospora]
MLSRLLSSPILATLAFVLFLAWPSAVEGLKFDMQAQPFHSGAKECFDQWVPRNTLVMVSLKAQEVQNQRVDFTVIDRSEAVNEYAKKRDVKEDKIAFTTQAHAEVSFCIQNHLADGIEPNVQFRRWIELHVDVGADAVDYNEVAKAEKLKPLEAELRHLEAQANEIVEELEFLQRRERKFRDTNESTNERVQFFSFVSTFALVALGIWQVIYLRKFFQSKKLI